MFAFLLALALASERCTSKVCDILMIVFGCFGIVIIAAFVFFVVRHRMRSRELERQAYKTSLVD